MRLGRGPGAWDTGCAQSLRGSTESKNGVPKVTPMESGGGQVNRFVRARVGRARESHLNLLCYASGELSAPAS